MGLTNWLKKDAALVENTRILKPIARGAEVVTSLLCCFYCALLLQHIFLGKLCLLFGCGQLVRLLVRNELVDLAGQGLLGRKGILNRRVEGRKAHEGIIRGRREGLAMLGRSGLVGQLQRVDAIEEVEDAAIGGEVGILEGPQKVEKAQIDVLLYQKAPVLLALISLHPYLDCDLWGSGNGGS